MPAAWQHERGREVRWLRAELSGALVVAICGDLVRPSLSCLVAGAAGKGSLTRNLARTRDPEGFARLGQLCDADPHVSAVAASLTLRRSAEIIAAKGGMLADITVGDALELMDREAESFTGPAKDHKVFYRMLRELGIFGDAGARAAAGVPHRGAAHARANWSTATSCTAGPSVTCSWTTCGNASPRWTTPA